MRTVIILVCLTINILSCKPSTKEPTNNSLRETISIDTINPCAESTNNLRYATNHFHEVKKCIDKYEDYTYAILEAIKSDEDKTHRYDLALLDSLYPIMDGAYAEPYIDVLFDKFKMFPENMIRYICNNKKTNLENGFIDAVIFFEEHKIISEEELDEILKKGNIDDECKDKLISQIINIE